MAGGNPFTKNPKKGNYNSSFDNAEVLKTSSDTKDTKDTNTISSILTGVLRPGETIDFSQEQTKNKEFEKPKIDNYIQKEQFIFINEHTQETKKEINNLRLEIKNLIETTENLDHEIKQSADQNVAEISEYQLTFFQRIKNLIINFRKNITEASIWLESFNHKKSKRNNYWNKFKDNGTKYLESGEHSASRSAS
jgi:Domain of unknown function (DUF5660)